MTNWISEELDHRPEQLENDGTNEGYVQRRNIEKIEATEDMPERYTCEMRFISVSEYEMLKAMQNIVSGNIEV